MSGVRKSAETVRSFAARSSGKRRAPEHDAEEAWQGQSNGVVNKVLPEDRIVHDWYRFVLSYPPHLVRHYVRRFGLGDGATLLDPFCGTGTTLVESMKLGVPSIGLEANPMAHLASSTKIQWSVDPDSLVEHAEQVAAAALREFEKDGLSDNGLPLFSKDQGRRKLRTLPPELQKLLLKDSISPLPCHKILVLLECLNRNFDERYRGHESLAIAKCLVTTVGNVRFGPEVGVGKAKEDAAVVGPWLDGIRTMAADLRALQGLPQTASRALAADSRHVGECLAPESVDAVITSPPYPNEKDYSRTTRLESVFLGYVKSRKDLRALKQQLIRSNTRGVYKDDDDDKYVAQHEEIQRVASKIESHRIELGKTSGFERLYARVTRLYFGGMARHLGDLRKVLRPGARLAYVVGDQASYLRVLIKTGEVLADIAEDLGYEVIGCDLFRQRRATATKSMLREEVLLLRWPSR